MPGCSCVDQGNPYVKASSGPDSNSMFFNTTYNRFHGRDDFTPSAVDTKFPSGYSCNRKAMNRWQVNDDYLFKLSTYSKEEFYKSSYSNDYVKPAGKEPILTVNPATANNLNANDGVQTAYAKDASLRSPYLYNPSEKSAGKEAGVPSKQWKSAYKSDYITHEAPIDDLRGEVFQDNSPYAPGVRQKPYFVMAENYTAQTLQPQPESETRSKFVKPVQRSVEQGFISPRPNAKVPSYVSQMGKATIDMLTYNPVDPLTGSLIHPHEYSTMYQQDYQPQNLDFNPTNLPPLPEEVKNRKPSPYNQDSVGDIILGTSRNPKDCPEPLGTTQYLDSYIKHPATGLRSVQNIMPDKGLAHGQSREHAKLYLEGGKDDEKMQRQLTETQKLAQKYRNSFAVVERK